MDPAIRRGRAVGGPLRELLIWLTQESKRPIDHRIIAKLREYGERCYAEGLAHNKPTEAITVPAPPQRSKP